MVDTIGRKLCQARLAKGLSIDEAAHETRVRPDKLVALENDDYSRFGSNAYAKGFLQIYGRFLGVDVTEQVRALETPHHVSISDYQYLNNAPEPAPTRIHMRGHEHQRPSFAPLLIMIGLMIAGAVVVAAYTFQITMERIEPRSAGQPMAATQAPTPTTTAPATPAGQHPAMSGSIGQGLTPASNPPPNATSGEMHAEGVPMGPAEPVAEMSPANLSNDTIDSTTGELLPAVASAPATNELIVEPRKKTWVKIRRDGPTAAPIFEDYVYPGARPLKLRGERFYVEVRDQDAVTIRKNGNPIAYRAPGISIQ